MVHFMGEEWELHPAGGATGEAYIAEHGDQKIFIKRNSSPFLAVLSAEGIVPKLLWTKRLENGDVITAQQWINSRELKSPEMKQNRVAKLLGKIHRSNELLDMFKRMGNSSLVPNELFIELQEKIEQSKLKNILLENAMKWLELNVSEINTVEHVVCHSDVNHNNWILSGDDSLYLIDWDGAIVADPALDLSQLLYMYVPKGEWRQWLMDYGVTMTENLEKRLRWYMVAQSVEGILWCHQRENINEGQKWSFLLSEVLNESELYSS
ncbi:phosphotransferase family protein [Evansella tamaricis]|uniref:Phosphotransferase family protein n=1 Tax=Evansella tamaricis TaxID=2069301 RepID=A0ABS6JN45_9BACI|nr:phosphotransferase family protein [Evansella tamaricis]MBU9713738.1 phosphotransferase family protein [Evansella tamaricis]